LSEPTIRSATRRDIGDVLALWRSAGSVPTVSDTPEAIETLLEHDADALVVAELAGQVAGTVIVGWDGWRGSLYRLAVAPERRRRGVASALVREGERRLRERGARRLTVIVVDDDERAMAFWKSTGLTRQAHRARFIQNF
jgi:ribosomal protein S18 acetylase RimI-like enzyme